MKRKRKSDTQMFFFRGFRVFFIIYQGRISYYGTQNSIRSEAIPPFSQAKCKYINNQTDVDFLVDIIRVLTIKSAKSY